MNDETRRAVKILCETVAAEIPSMPEWARDQFEGTIEGLVEHILDNPNLSAERLTFGEAIDHLKRGRRVTRDGWNGKRMWLVYVRDRDWGLAIDSVASKAAFPSTPMNPNVRPFIAMYTVDGSLVPWLASQTDMLAEDWRVVLDVPTVA